MSVRFTAETAVESGQTAAVRTWALVLLLLFSPFPRRPDLFTTQHWLPPAGRHPLPVVSRGGVVGGGVVRRRRRVW